MQVRRFIDNHGEARARAIRKRYSDLGSKPVSMGRLEV